MGMGDVCQSDLLVPEWPSATTAKKRLKIKFKYNSQLFRPFYFAFAQSLTYLWNPINLELKTK